MDSEDLGRLIAAMLFNIAFAVIIGLTFSLNAIQAIVLVAIINYITYKNILGV